MTTTLAWTEDFTARVRDHTRFDAAARAVPVELPVVMRHALVRSLQRFQAGEGSGGRLAQVTSSDPLIDDELRVSLPLFVAEELRHARLLAEVLRSLGAPILAEDGSTKLFVFARNLLGLRGKLIVLNVAEIVGLIFYESVAETVPCPQIAAVAEHIAADERRHFDYHRVIFRRMIATSRWPRTARLLWSLWFIKMLVAGVATVIVDQAPWLRVSTLNRRHLVRRSARLGRLFLKGT